MRHLRWPLWPVAVTERSMEPSLRPGDWLLAWRGLRPGAAPRIRPGQVVIAAYPGRPGFWLIKRAARREPGGWWLESDNAGVPAVDSRAFGPVPAAQIAGRVLLRYHRGPRPAPAAETPAAEPRQAKAPAAESPGPPREGTGAPGDIAS
jgi:hypothetical protein